MASLKTFIESISGPLGVNPIALYERQRELVRAGIIKLHEGRGPGSGARLTAENAAYLTISLLASDNLSTVANATSEIASATRVGKSSMTSARTLVEAVALMMTDAESAAAIGDLVLERQLRRARLESATRQSVTVFRNPQFKHHRIDGFFTTVTLPRRNLIKISGAYQKLSEQH